MWIECILSGVRGRLLVLQYDEDRERVREEEGHAVLKIFCRVMAATFMEGPI